MSSQSSLAQVELVQERTRTREIVNVQPKSITIVIRWILLILSALALSILSVVVFAKMGATSTIIEPPLQFSPGNTLPKDIHCGQSADETCYPPVDAHCYESGDANRDCFTSASIQFNGKTIVLTIDIASRTIALTSIPAHEYMVGDLLLAWGTPTGFSQSGRDIDVYWSTKSAHITTCSFRPESHVDVITYYRDSAFASPWQGFVRVKSKDC